MFRHRLSRALRRRGALEILLSRVDEGRSRDTGGAGLGLAIVKHLVESMDGSISVESKVGEGTKFFVTLPAASA